jgi:excisionase family DNA binding protein
MALRTLDPDTFTEEERASLQEQIKNLLELAKQCSEDPSPTGSTRDEISKSASFPEKTVPPPFLEGKKDKIIELLRKTIEKEEHSTHLNVKIGGEEISMPLPRHFMTLVFELLTEVAQGHSVSVGSEGDELTTSEAAELLNVSRPHLVKLLEEGKIPFRKVGTHRRVQRNDVLEYKRKQRKEAEEAMQNLADQAQELGLGY